MNEFELQGSLLKFDPISGAFEGVLALEVEDKSGETMDYAKSVPNFKSWSEEIHKASGGKSYGNIRLMHNKHVAGRFTEPLTFDDENKRIIVKGEVVDPLSKELMHKGCLTGLSIGGKYGSVKKDPITGKSRYVAVPSEASLVDNPSMYGAYIMVKAADGSETKVELKGGLPDFDNLEKSYSDVITMTETLRSMSWVYAESEENREKILSLRKKTAKILVELAKELSEDNFLKTVEPQQTTIKTTEDTEMTKEEMELLQKGIVDSLSPNFTSISESLQKAVNDQIATVKQEVSTETDAKIEVLTKAVGDLSEMVSNAFGALTGAAPVGDLSKGVRMGVDKKMDTTNEPAPKEEEEEEERPSTRMTKMVHNENKAFAAMKKSIAHPVTELSLIK